VLFQTRARSLAGTAGVLLTFVGLAFWVPKLRAQADFQVNANLVVLRVTVADPQGKAVPDLPRSAFHIVEDDVPQTVTLFQHEDSPVAVGLVVDNSGSMLLKLPHVVAAATAFARSSNPGDQMFVVNFNESVSLGLPPGQAFVSNPGQLKTAMLQIRARGQTALYDAVATALEHIRESPLQEKVLIVLSDGGDNASSIRFAEVLDQEQRSDTIVYCVGLFDAHDKDRNPSVLGQLAQASGGTAYFPKEIPEVKGILAAVSRDIRDQYTIGYIPVNGKRDGTFRRIRVTLTGPNSDRWSVRTRPGYFSPLPDAGGGEAQRAK
jgi:Ca-activated chloride channel family protein